MTVNPGEHHHDDPALERGLESIRSHWKSASGDEPHGLLDQAVLNAARREAESRRGRRRLRWLGGFATAAVVVMAATLVVRQLPYQGPAPPPREGDGFRLEPDASAETGEPMVPPGPAPLATRPAGEFSGKAGEEKSVRAFSAPGADAAPPEAQSLQIEERDATAEAQTPEAGGVTAEEWIERLLELKQSGQKERLALELTAFRSAFPGYPLPPELAE